MATVAAASYQRRKKVTTYGKANRNSPYNIAQFDAFFDDSNPQQDGLDVVEETTHARQKDRPSKRTKHEASKTSSDAFDVPSSEDEEKRMVTTKPPSPTRLRARNKLVVDEAPGPQLLASWERKALQQDTSSPADDDRAHRPVRCVSQDAANASLNAEVAVAAVEPGMPASVLAPRAPTAAARLAARKRAGDLPKPGSRLSEGGAFNAEFGRSKSGVTSATPRKRRRDHQESSSQAIERQPAVAHNPSSQGNGEFRMPSLAATGALDCSSPKSGRDEVTRSTAKQAGQQADTYPDESGMTGQPLMTIRKGLSAPARLVDLLPSDTDQDRERDVVESHAAASTHNGHNGLSETPAAKEAQDPARLQRAESLTPKQAQLWNQLLPSDPAAESPGKLPLPKLQLAGRRAGSVRPIRNDGPSNPDRSRRRARLVDSLKASILNVEEEELGNSDNSDSRSDFLAEEPGESTPRTFDTTAAEASSLLNVHEPAESQPKLAQTASQNGPKMTYARTRSYLQEESLEDGILGSMTGATVPQPQRSANDTYRRDPTVRTSTFDLEDSDDEGPHGRLRTIHELRAAGRTKRFAQDAQALLDDIAAHGVAARSRRRAALLEMAFQLLDQDFARQCVDQGFEQQLFRELSHGGDAIANFLIGTAAALILTAGPPEHSVLALYSDGGLTKLAALFGEHTAVADLAKIRAYNMSKASQIALSAFLTRLQSQTSLWGDRTPTAITPRLIGLKAADLAFERLKTTKYSSAMLSDDALLSVLPERDDWDSLEMAIAISILEVVSLCSPLLLWPEDILSHIGTLLENLEPRAPATQHTWFLTFRLSASLTNQSEKNCAILGTPKAVARLLSAALDGFTRLGAHVDEEQRKLDLDLLLLSISILFNLTLHTTAARASAIEPRSSSTLSALIDILVDGQETIQETETLEQTTRNVPFGYLAVMLANLCQNPKARGIVAAQLPGQGLELLLTAVTEFVQYHEQVDTIASEGEEGASVWGAYTGQMRSVLSKLKDAQSLM